jgi:hypothetical protein
MTDALKTYRAKRNFSLTPEPAEGGEEGGEARAFVIQKHWASRLHYDLRLDTVPLRLRAHSPTLPVIGSTTPVM